jgi:serine/threonine protein kinase
MSLIQLNDFNRARFIRWNAVKHEACPFHVGLAPGRVRTCLIICFSEITKLTKNFLIYQNRSPEEYGDSPLTEKIDVYSLGNAFLYILTGTTSILPHLKERDAIHEIVHGSVKLDAEFIEKLDEKELAISHAIKMCHVKEPSVRSSSADVEKYLRRKIEDFQIERYS